VGAALCRPFLSIWVVGAASPLGTMRVAFYNVQRSVGAIINRPRAAISRPYKGTGGHHVLHFGGYEYARA